MTTYRAEWQTFVKVNVFANARIENENPEKLIDELSECPGLEPPTIGELLYHLYVRKAAWAGRNNLVITVHHN